MNHQLNYEILVRYLADEGSEEDIEVVNAWLKADTVNEQKLKVFQYIWDSASIKRNLKHTWFDIEEDWDQVKKRIEKQEKAPVERSNAPSINYRRHSGWHQLLRIAAVFLIVGFIGFFVYQKWGGKGASEGEPALREIATKMGQRVDLTLSDGTRVILNADSKITLPREFKKDKREVTLQGQAYFHVAKNPDKPFIIHSGHSLTTVLGTSFSIKAYPEDKDILLVVKEGRVAFETDGKNTRQKNIVTGKELARYNIEDRNVQEQKIDDLTLYLSWTKGYLKFKEAPMSKVALDLERRYDIHVAFRDDEIKNFKLSAILKSRSIRNVLDVIAASFSIHYRMEKNNVIFYE